MTEFLAGKLAQPAVGWSIGVFGALAEFHRDAHEPAEVRDLTVVTPRGAIRLGRIEVYQRIGEPGGRTPDGPHTHLLPKLLQARRTHSANAILPPGLVPCAAFYSGRGD